MTATAGRSPADAAAEAAAASRATEPLRGAFLRACRLDVAVRKPGNVSVESPGHRMTAAQFVASAEAAAPAIGRAGARVGDRIEAATRASWAAAGCNTNLGIVLLCAPLAAAAERLAAAPSVPPAAAPRGAAAAPSPGPHWALALRDALREVLAGLDVDDARAAYRAIAHANPGGLGESAQQDVRTAPSVDLRAAMALAAPRDRIAQQYVDGFAAVFEIGLPAWRGAAAPPLSALDGLPLDAPVPPAWAAGVQRTYLALLSSGIDSHIVRKRGAAPAHTVLGQAQAWLRDRGRLVGADGGAAAIAWAGWDQALKADGINPGSTADLTVASLLVAGLLDGCSAA